MTLYVHCLWAISTLEEVVCTNTRSLCLSEVWQVGPWLTLSTYNAGMLLMNMKYSSERQATAELLAPNIVDPENAYSHLLPYIACESLTVREKILQSIVRTQ
jgi:hypothetical protein